MTNAPYAGPSAPAGTPSHTSASPRARPYIPLAWRSAAVAQDTGQAGQGDASEQMIAPEEALPPIAEFLAEGPAPWSEPSRPNVGTASRDSAAEPGEFDSYQGATGEPHEATARGDDWPFADAGAETVELTGELRAPDPVSPPAAASGHLMWNDDDLMDIMPSPGQQSSADAPWSSSGAGEAARSEVPLHEPGADGNRHDAAGDSQANNESAARALEALARRVRTGELALPGYVPELGDAAALAATLAALLGIRRG